MPERPDTEVYRHFLPKQEKHGNYRFCKYCWYGCETDIPDDLYKFENPGRQLHGCLKTVNNRGHLSTGGMLKHARSHGICFLGSGVRLPERCVIRRLPENESALEEYPEGMENRRKPASAGTPSTPKTNDDTDDEYPDECHRRKEGTRTEVKTPSCNKRRMTADAPSVEKDTERSVRRKRQRATEEIHEKVASVAQAPVQDSCVFSTQGLRARDLVAPLARDLLAMPASTADLERTFSQAGRICTPRRLQIDPKLNGGES